MKENYFVKHKKGVYICIIAVVLLLICVAGILSNSQKNNFKFNQVDGKIPDEKFSRVVEVLQSMFESNSDASNNILDMKVLIRPSSYEEYKDTNNAERATFLVDIDAIKRTYRVDFSLDGDGKMVGDPLLSCAALYETKYPDEQCPDMLSVTLGEYLPHRFILDDGRVVNVTLGYSEENGGYLKVWVGSCGDEEIEEEALVKTKEWIESLGYDASKLEIVVEGNCEVSLIWKEDNINVF